MPERSEPDLHPQALAAAPPEVLLDQLVHVSERLRHYGRWKQELQDALTVRHELGQVADQVELPDAVVSFCAGRVSYDYPAAVTDLEEALQQARESAIALGQAQQRCGRPFWTVRERPSPHRRPQ